MGLEAAKFLRAGQFFVFFLPTLLFSQNPAPVEVEADGSVRFFCGARAFTDNFSQRLPEREAASPLPGIAVAPADLPVIAGALPRDPRSIVRHPGEFY